MGFSRQEYWSGLPLPSPIKLAWYINLMFSLRYGVAKSQTWLRDWPTIEHFKTFQGYCISMGKLFQIYLVYINPEGYQSWILIGRTDAEAEAPILWPPEVKSRLIRKDLDAGEDWRQEKGKTKDKMVGWHHQWTWVRTSSRRQRRTGNPGMLQSMGLQRVGHDWVTEQQQYIPPMFAFPFKNVIKSLK